MSNSIKRRIAFFGVKYYPSKGGSSRIAESLARELCHKYDITIYCYKNDLATNYLDKINVVNVPRIPLGQLGVFLYYFVCCAHIILLRRFDLVHVHKTDSAVFIPVLASKSKVIATSQEAPYLRDKWTVLGKKYFRLMEWCFVHSPALLTAVSKPLSDYYFEKYGKIVHYVPNGVTITNERHDNKAKELLLKNGVAEDDKYILFAARRIMSTKGCHTFLEAMRQTRFEGKILIAGEESHATSYVEKIRKLSVDLEVAFLGYIDDKSILMALVEGAELFVFPSETEGLSLMLLEVGSTGLTPLICSDIPENTQVFNEDEVLYFNNRDANDLADKIQWASSHMSVMKDKANKARLRVVNEYSSSVISAKYDAYYDNLLAETPKGLGSN